MKTALTVLGVLMMIAGVIWVGQGLGLVPGGFMYENPTWIYIGAATAVVGAAIIFFARCRKA
jgi:hypothetical protein